MRPELHHQPRQHTECRPPRRPHAGRHAQVSQGGGSVSETRNFAHNVAFARKSGDGPKFALNFSRGRTRPNFRKNLSKLWPVPSCGLSPQPLTLRAALTLTLTPSSKTPACMPGHHCSAPRSRRDETKSAAVGSSSTTTPASTNGSAGPHTLSSTRKTR